MTTLDEFDSLSMLVTSLFLRTLSCPVKQWASPLLPECCGRPQFDFSPTLMASPTMG
jgi:hypothetical protein